MLKVFLDLPEEYRILIVLYVMSYLSAMLIQIKDPKAKVEFLDWIVAFLCSAMGAIIMFFGVMSWANVGVRMAATILVSLMSYRTILFIVAPQRQDEFASTFWSRFMKLFNDSTTDTKNKNNE